MSDCIFCKIITGQIPSNKVYEDEYLYAFHDINPAAPVHLLIVPKEHIASANEINMQNSHIVAKVFELSSKLARDLGISKNGYRVVNNCGEHGGQSVSHLHFHMLGGRQLSWPPG